MSTDIYSNLTNFEKEYMDSHGYKPIKFISVKSLKEDILIFYNGWVYKVVSIKATQNPSDEGDMYTVYNVKLQHKDYDDYIEENGLDEDDDSELIVDEEFLVHTDSEMNDRDIIDESIILVEFDSLSEPMFDVKKVLATVALFGVVLVGLVFLDKTKSNTVK